MQIEDTVVVRSQGGKRLTRAPEEAIRGRSAQQRILTYTSKHKTAIVTVVAMVLAAGLGFYEKSRRGGDGRMQKLQQDRQSMDAPGQHQQPVFPTQTHTAPPRRVESQSSRKEWWDERKDVDPYRRRYGVYAERQATTWLVQEDGSLKKGVGHSTRVDPDIEGYDSSYRTLVQDLLKQSVISPGDSICITEGLNYQQERAVAVDIWGKKETKDHLGSIRAGLEQHFSGSAKVGNGWIVEDDDGLTYCRFELQLLRP